jgi:hypothetical protein
LVLLPRSVRIYKLMRIHFWYVVGKGWSLIRGFHLT